MIIYEKKVNGAKKLFGSVKNVKTADDKQIVLVDADGDVIDPRPTLNATYVNGKDGGIVRLNDGQKVNVGIEDKTGTVKWVIGEPVAKVVKSIKVKTKPTKLAYKVNDVLDLTGMVVEATFESGEKEIISAGDGGYTVTPANGSTLTLAGETTITVSYSGKEASFKVTVSANEAAE